MTRSSEEVGAAWGKLFGVAVDACKSHHAAHTAAAEGHGPLLDRKRRDANEDPNSEATTITVTTHQRCRPTWTGRRGDVLVNYDKQGPLQFDQTPVYLLAAGQNLATAAQTATPNPMQMTGPGAVEVTVEPQLPRGLYVGTLHEASGAAQSLLIYVDDVI